MQGNRDNEIDAAVLGAIEAANRRDQRYPTLGELIDALRAAGVTPVEVAASTDRLYRRGKLNANARGGLSTQLGPGP